MQTQKLTKRETEVLIQLAQGRLNKEISNELDISIDTVKKHVKNIYHKISARNRIDAVHYYLMLNRKNLIYDNS